MELCCIFQPSTFLLGSLISSERERTTALQFVPIPYLCSRYQTLSSRWCKNLALHLCKYDRPFIPFVSLSKKVSIPALNTVPILGTERRDEITPHMFSLKFPQSLTNCLVQKCQFHQDPFGTPTIDEHP